MARTGAKVDNVRLEKQSKTLNNSIDVLIKAFGLKGELSSIPALNPEVRAI